MSNNKFTCNICASELESELDYTDDELSDYNEDLFEIDEFIDLCKHDIFTDYDGCGLYANSDELSKIQILPSEAAVGKVQEGWTHVAWFNR